MPDKDSPNGHVKKGTYKSDGSTKYMRLKALDCFDEVLEMIRYGYPRPRIAKFIQEENGEYEGVTQDSLIRTIHRFMKEEFHQYEEEVDEDLSDEDDLPAKTEEQALERQKKEETLNVLDEYTSLYRLQKDRIDQAVKREKQSTALMSDIGKEVRIAAEILNNIGSYQQDVGILPRQARQVDVNLTARTQQPVSSTTEEIADDPSRRGRLLKFFQVTNQLSETAFSELGDDGDVIDADFELAESKDD